MQHGYRETAMGTIKRGLALTVSPFVIIALIELVYDIIAIGYQRAESVNHHRPKPNQDRPENHSYEPGSNIRRVVIINAVHQRGKAAQHACANTDPKQHLCRQFDSLADITEHKQMPPQEQILFQYNSPL
jgi:hypothetical protein